MSQIASERGTGGGIASERGSRHKRNTPPFRPSPRRASHHERSSPPLLPPLAASTAVTARRGGASDGGARRARAPHRPQQRTRLIERDARVGDHEQHGLRRGGEDSAVRHDGRLKPTTHAGVTVARPIASRRQTARASIASVDAHVITPTSRSFRRRMPSSIGTCVIGCVVVSPVCNPRWVAPLSHHSLVQAWWGRGQQQARAAVSDEMTRTCESSRAAERP